MRGFCDNDYEVTLYDQYLFQIGARNEWAICILLNFFFFFNLVFSLCHPKALDAHVFRSLALMGKLEFHPRGRRRDL